jgi:hypothetical protein
MHKHISQFVKLCSLFLALSLLLGACRSGIPAPSAEPPVQQTTAPTEPQQEAPPTKAETSASPTETAVEPDQSSFQPVVGKVLELVFARFQQPPVEITPSIHQEAVAPDLSNVYNPFVLSQEQIDRLAQDGFVVTPGTEKEFFTVYERARYANVPIFVTSDSLLHSYHLLFDKVLRTAERQHFIPLLKDLNAALLESTQAEYQTLKGTAWEEAALRTVAFVGVASKLLDPAVQIPAEASDLVEAEIALIESASGIRPSPIFPTYDYGEDYTQYIPRGHYTMSEDLEAYFKSMMWYGRMSFRLKTQNPEAGRSESRMALLLVQALRNSQVNGSPALEVWADLYSPTVFFVGRSDDLTIAQYIAVIDQVYGPDASLSTIADDSLLDTFIETANQLPPPKILGMVIAAEDDEEAQTKGLRFMGQRFVPDAYIFRQLIYRNVGTGSHRRGLPKGLDLMAAMGSERAYQILDAAGDTQFENYPQQMEKVQNWLSGLTSDEWTETLYNSWLYSFYPLLDVPGEGYPAFMQTQAWQDKQLNTALGSWAELKHDTILYAKQVYAELGGGPPAPEPVPPKGYVEPVPEFYARLSALTTMTIDGLDERGLLNDLDRSSLQRLDELVRGFKAMAEKELTGEPLSDEEYNTIRFYGGELEHFVMAAADSESDDPFAQQYMEEEPQAAVVADVATDPDPDNDGAPNPVVLEEAVGRINDIHVIVPLIQADGSIALQVAKGGVFSYYEFQWPAEDRLTDEAWHDMLDQGQAPDLPDWTGSFFTSQGEFSALKQAVQDYERNTTNLYWDPANFLPVYAENQAEQDKISQIFPELQSLRENQQYAGHQLVSVNFISHDFESEERAIATVREVWDDTLYKGEYPDIDDPVIGQRGPYALDVTYAIQRFPSDFGPRWEVVSASYSQPIPEWQMN